MNAIHQRASILQQQRRYADAEREWRQALSADPDDAVAHAMLALCLLEQDRRQDATAEADQALRLEPAMPLVHYVMAVVFLKRNFLDDALAAVQEAISLDPYDADYFSLLAAIRLEGRNWPAALEAAEKGLSIDPEHVRCTNMRAMALVKLGRRDEAGQTIDAALHKNPEDALSHANQGWTLLHAGQHVKAMEHFREALRLEPNMEWARLGIVEALKSRHFIYRWLLMYFLWMSRLSRRAQWGILLGGYFGVRMLGNLAEQNPGLAPVVMPVVWAYVAMVLLTWLADPLFNLLLRLSRFGRLVLSPQQVLLSNIIGSLFLGALALAGVFFATRYQPWANGALFCVFFTILVTAVLRCPLGWPRYAMAGALAIMIGLTAATLYFEVQAWRVHPERTRAQLREEVEQAKASWLPTPQARVDYLRRQIELNNQQDALFDRSQSFFNVFVIGMLAMSIGGNALASVRLKR